jgi:hypothetical protein
VELQHNRLLLYGIKKWHKVYAGFKNGVCGADESDIQFPGQIERILRDRLSAGDHHGGGADHIRRADNLGGVEVAEQKDVLFVRCQDIAHQARRYNPPCKFPASPVQEFPLHPGSGFINKNFRTHDFQTFFFDQERQRKTSEKECTADEKNPVLKIFAGFITYFRAGQTKEKRSGDKVIDMRKGFSYV